MAGRGRVVGRIPPPGRASLGATKGRDRGAPRRGVADALTDDEVLDAEDDNVMVVTGERPRGTVDTDIPAEVTLNPRD